MSKYIVRNGYGKTKREIDSTESLYIFLKKEFREQWWINGYKTFIKEINRNIKLGKKKIFEYAGFTIEEHGEEVTK